MRFKVRSGGVGKREKRERANALSPAAAAGKDVFLELDAPRRAPRRPVVPWVLGPRAPGVPEPHLRVACVRVQAVVRLSI